MSCLEGVGNYLPYISFERLAKTATTNTEGFYKMKKYKSMQLQ